MRRSEVFERDEWRCVYCGQVHPAGLLSVDHVQPKVKGGDNSGGNVVTACMACNTMKGSRSLALFLSENEDARRNFFSYARYVWPRHLRAVAEELVRRGIAMNGPDFVEGVRGLHDCNATASLHVAGETEGE